MHVLLLQLFYSVKTVVTVSFPIISLFSYYLGLSTANIGSATNQAITYNIAIHGGHHIAIGDNSRVVSRQAFQEGILYLLA